MTKNLYFYETPVGKIGLADNGRAITDLFFGEDSPLTEYIINETELLKSAYKQLMEYFSGSRKIFDLSLAFEGTSFQQKVWKALLTIPYGQVRSYKDIAKQIGNEKACRAVGIANNRNRVGIIIPCDRVIGSDGKLVGYGGGLDIKRYLLQLEGVL
ncbi:MAG: methylated-DNA--[protein]-cysteine S-methyltransferase [Clostridiales bacterium]|nr:methylated-DNA--[protein]-cysteine S-methyltransferase [Clostridiales bacterium]